LLIEAQTGRENKSKMGIRGEENQKTVPKMAGKIKWPRANRNSFICVCINFESCKLTHLAKPLFIIQIIYVQYLFSHFFASFHLVPGASRFLTNYVNYFRRLARRFIGIIAPQKVTRKYRKLPGAKASKFEKS